MPEYIDKDYVIDEINRIGANAFKDYSDYSNLFDFVDEATPADVAPVIHAKWENITTRKGSVIAVRCSNCKLSPKYAVKSSYCPNCGAKMDRN